MGAFEGKVPDGRRHLPVDLDGGSQQTTDQGDLQGEAELFCPHRLGRNQAGQSRVLCYQYGGDSESGLGPAGSPANWRCIV